MSDPYKIGMIGLGVMGRNLVLNMADHNTSVVGYDKDPEQVHRLVEAAAGRPDGVHWRRSSGLQPSLGSLCRA